MPLSRRESRRMINEMAVEYDEASRPQKMRIISNIVDLTGFTRSAVGRALRIAKLPKGRKRSAPRKKRGRTYGPDVVIALSKVWAVLDYPSVRGWLPSCLRCSLRWRGLESFD